MMKKIFSIFDNKKSPEEVKQLAAEKREEIMGDGALAKRLLAQEDFLRFLQILKDDRDKLNLNLITENPDDIKTHEQNIRLIARINQIDKIINKPKNLIWQMENLTEVRTALQEKK